MGGDDDVEGCVSVSVGNVGSKRKKNKVNVRKFKKKIRCSDPFVEPHGTFPEWRQHEKDNGAILIPVEKVVERSVAALGINKSTVVTICKEKERVNGVGNTTLETHGKKRRKQKIVTALDGLQQDAIRRHTRCVDIVCLVSPVHQLIEMTTAIRSDPARWRERGISSVLKPELEGADVE
ncbi:hypothetical protein J6590_103961 [Homalodisca vitripennis]|nr:hypothetical protein J6590_103961 [Homalodisca vitripennis]